MLRILIRWLKWVVVLGLLAVFAVAVFLFVDYKRFMTASVVGKETPKTFVVNSGDNIIKLVNRFKQQGIELAPDSPLSRFIGPYYFRHLARSSGKANHLKVGEYQLREGMSAVELFDVLVSGPTVSYQVRFNEGWTFKQMRSAMRKSTNIEQSLASVSDHDVMKLIGVEDGLSYEGMFFPDTYQFTNHTKDSTILLSAYRLMQTKLAKAWAARDKNIKLRTPYELLILASLIEKETGLDGEREKISGVFHRRLAKGMPLQTDPTVIYGMGDKYKGKLYYRHLQQDTPYNTYTRKGLPPTPIAMPGMESLIAAGHPDKGNSLYFVANGRGGHTFSDTYKAHLKAVKAYRRLKKKP